MNGFFSSIMVNLVITSCIYNEAKLLYQGHHIFLYNFLKQYMILVVFNLSTKECFIVMTINLLIA
ncbi:hypothetical protein BLOT_008835 [Blomia tropicalis]|nr:hypothetical protein BLOT_008835 [Blomia tropicalis]